MALLYQCNGLERANPHWHTNQSLSIMMMTDFPIINMPAVLHMKSTLIVSTSMSVDTKTLDNLKGFSFTFIQPTVYLILICHIDKKP